MSKYSFSSSARAMRQRNNPPGSALMCSRLSLRKGYSGETSSESFSKSSRLRIITFVTSKTPGMRLASFLRRLSSVLAFAANAAYCFSFSLLHLKFLEISLCSSRKRGAGVLPRCVWISKRYACASRYRLGQEKRRYPFGHRLSLAADSFHIPL